MFKLLESSLFISTHILLRIEKCLPSMCFGCNDFKSLKMVVTREKNEYQVSKLIEPTLLLVYMLNVLLNML